MAPRLARWARLDRRGDIVYVRGSPLSDLYPRDQYRHLASLFPQETEVEIYPRIPLGGEDRGIELEGEGVEKFCINPLGRGIFLYFSRFSI